MAQEAVEVLVEDELLSSARRGIIVGNLLCMSHQPLHSAANINQQTSTYELAQLKVAMWLQTGALTCCVVIQHPGMHNRP